MSFKAVFSKGQRMRGSIMTNVADRLRAGGIARFFGISFAIWSLMGSVGSATATESPITIEALVRNQRVEGTPLAASKSNVILLKRNGEVIEFTPGEARDYQKTANGFAPYSPAIMRGQLEREFGPAFEVTGTGHFLVVHPKGQQQWADRFEQMYRSCIMYFKVRGFAINDPEFPLVAIVFPNRDDFLRYALNEGATQAKNYLGYYSLKTNRVALFDNGAGRNNAQLNDANIATVYHEASHQTAFNTGIHKRYAGTPRWVVEGLGTLFEARGVNDSRSYPSAKDRINQERLKEFRVLLPKRKPGRFLELLNSDRMFEQDMSAAYAESWAFTFFLIETMPREYARYLAKTAARQPFTDYLAAERVKDFTDVFGENIALLEAKFLRYIAELN
jgi:hypothetical protein